MSYQQCHAFPSLLLGVVAALLQQARFASSLARPSEESTASSAPAGRFVVPLHRQRVPVQSDAGTISYKSVYFGTISVGAPEKQQFSVVFDTGSGHVIVPSEACTSETCQIHRRYDRQRSLQAVDVDYDGSAVQPGAPRDQITVAFGTGEVTGQFVQDRLCLGWGDEGKLVMDGDAAPPAGVRQQRSNATGEVTGDNEQWRPNCVELRVVTATEMTHEPFHAFAFDGVLGLGLDGLALAPEFSFFGMLVAQRRLLRPSFGVFLADSDDEVSEISFGGNSPELLRGGLSWAPVAYPELGYWQVAITRLRIGNRIVDFCEDGQCRAVVDTGTSLLAVPKDFADELQDTLSGALVDPKPGADGEVDCKDALGELLHFEVGDLTLTLEPGDYARQSIMVQDEASEDAQGGGDQAAGAATAESGTPHEPEHEKGEKKEHSAEWDGAPRSCRPTLMPIDLPEPLGPKLFIWGEPVLRKYYTEYNWKEKTIGFGLAKHTWQEDRTTPPPSSTTAVETPKPRPLLRPLLL